MKGAVGLQVATAVVVSVTNITISIVLLVFKYTGKKFLFSISSSMFF